MKNQTRLVGSVCALALSTAFIAPSFGDPSGDVEPALQDVIIVTGNRADKARETAISPNAGPLEGADLTRTLIRTPGAARIGNGELSGQVQYRGLWGERLNLRVDGQRFGSGGPNLMDPAFHYAPSTLVDTVIVDRGVSPVSKGAGLGGGMDAVFKRIGYADSSEVSFGYDFTAGVRSVNESYAVGGVAGASTDTWRFNLLGSVEDGEDTEFAGGTIAGTQYRRAVYGGSGGLKLGNHKFTVDLRRHEAGPAGNPPFPMDIRFFDTDFLRLGYATEIGGVELAAALNYIDVAHGMNNFDLRPSPPTMALRETFAYATTRSAQFQARFDALGGEMAIGLDAENVTHDMLITNPTNADFFVTGFPDISMETFGAFAEWTSEAGPVMAELGLRVDQHRDEAGEARLGPALPVGPNMVANAFNAADRTIEETTLDVVARLWTPEKGGLSYRATLARKQQMPGYIQRFGWLPINASGGLADGNIYVGDLTLEPETATILELGVDYFGSHFYARPTIFVRDIENYIQGVPFDDTPGLLNTPQEMIANMNGDAAPLIWGNVEAQLVGFDLDAGYDFNGPLRFDAVASYVRGERQDVSDNLYRIAPPSLMVALTWEQAAWSTTMELRAVGKQNNVAFNNNETKSEAYQIINLYADWSVKDGVLLAAGIENLFDESYRDHLSGVNRNGFGDAGLGQRVPGAGRGVFVRLSFKG